MFRSIPPTRIVILPFLLMILAGCATPIQRAAKEGDLHKLRELIDSGADPNEGAPLVHAVCAGKKESVIYLLNKGANLNQVSYGYSMLFHAIFHNQWDIARILVEHGADAESTAAEYEAYGMAVKGKTHFLSYKAKADRLRRDGGSPYGFSRSNSSSPSKRSIVAEARPHTAQVRRRFPQVPVKGNSP